MLKVVINNYYRTLRKAQQLLKYDFKKEIILHGITLEETLEDAILLSKKLEKPLIIYLHNVENEFSRLFMELIANETVKDLFKYFTFFAWEVHEDGANERLKIIAELQPYLRPIRTKIHEKAASLFFFMSYKEQIELHTTFKGTLETTDFIVCLFKLYKLHEEQKLARQELVQIDCVKSAIRNFEEEYGSNWMTFAEDPSLYKAIEIALQAQPVVARKILVLWYFNKDNRWSKMLADVLMEREIRDSMKNRFYIIPWNVENERYHSALKDSVRVHFDLKVMNDTIDIKENALFFFINCNAANQPLLSDSLIGQFRKVDFRLKIEEIQREFEIAHEITDSAEILTCESFLTNVRYFSLEWQLNTTSKPLHVIIQDIYLKRKMLLLWFYQDDSLAENIAKVVEENFELINYNFVIVPWYISTAKYHKELLLALRRHFNLEDMEVLVKLRGSGMYIFMPIGNSLALFSTIHKDTSALEILGILKGAVKIYSNKNVFQKTSNVGPAQFQKAVYKKLGNRDYDCFRLDRGEGEYLKQKIYFAFYGADDYYLEPKIKMKREAKVTAIFEKIVKYARPRMFSANRNEIVVTYIFNYVLPITEERIDLNFSLFPIFVIRKCSNCRYPCRIFIDHDERVYTTWHNYLNNNKLPKCLFIVPMDGKYQSDMWGELRLECRLSPSCSESTELLNDLDRRAQIVSATVNVINVARLLPFISFGPIIGTGLMLTGLTTGVYSMVRSGMMLNDRDKHDQSLSIKNSEARAAYLNIVAGTCCFTSTAATTTLRNYAKTGRNIGQFHKYSVNAVNSMNILVSGVAVGNSSYEVLNKWRDTNQASDGLTLLQLSTSILFFGQAVCNLKTANTIIHNAQVQALREIKESLQTNYLQKTKKVITYIKKLNNYEDVLSTLKNSRQLLSENGIDLRIQGDQINFNDVSTNISSLTNLSKILRNTLPKLQSNPLQDQMLQNIIREAPRIVAGTILDLLRADSVLFSMVQRVVGMFSELVQEKLIELAQTFLNEINVDIYKNFLTLSPKARVTVKIFEMIVDYFKRQIPKDDFSDSSIAGDKEMNRRRNTKRFINCLEILIITSTRGSISTLMKEITSFAATWVAERIFEMCENNIDKDDSLSKVYSSMTLKSKCGTCKGFYYQ